MSNDENACILKLCNQNLETNVRKCILLTFDRYIDETYEKLENKDKKSKQKKAMKRFQEKLKFIAMGENSEDLHENFFQLLCREIDYLETILTQITKLKLQLLSKMRTTRATDMEMKIPDRVEFAKEILKRNSYTFFHSVPLYFHYHLTRNVLQIKPIIDSVTQEVMDGLTTKSYSLFFSRPPEPHVVYDDQMDEILKNSGSSKPKRFIPKAVEDAYKSEYESREDTKSQNKTANDPKDPEYRIIEMDPVDEEIKSDAGQMQNEKIKDQASTGVNEESKDNKDTENVQEMKLQTLLQRLKEDTKSDMSEDDLEDSLPM